MQPSINLSEAVVVKAAFAKYNKQISLGQASFLWGLWAEQNYVLPDSLDEIYDLLENDYCGLIEEGGSFRH